jgi:CHASE1-domain containing sensor protein
MTLAPLRNFIAALRTLIAAPHPRGQAADHHRQERHAGTPDSHPMVARKGRPAGEQPLLHTQHVVPIVTTALLGAVLSVAAWFVVSRWEDRTTELEFNARTSNVALILQTGMNEYFNKVVALRALFSSSTRGVTRSEFDGFSHELLQGQTAMLSASWIPRVKEEERIEHELAAVRDGIAGYHIRSATADGNLVTSAERNEYFPVYYASEKERSDSIYGLDLGDEGLREEALSRARDGDRLVASELFVLLRAGTGDRRGFFVLLPVYKPGPPHDTVEERRRNLAGFVKAVFQTSVMIDTILRDVKTPSLDLYVFAAESGSGGLPIHTHPSSLRIRSIQSKPLDILTAGPHWLGALEVADRKWTLITVPSN